MTGAKTRNLRVFVAVNREVANAIQRGGPAPVREMAQRIVQSLDVPKDEFEAIFEAVCTVCVRSGLVLEFTGRWSDIGRDSRTQKAA